MFAGAEGCEYYPGGQLKQCRLGAPQLVVTPSGVLMAQGAGGEVRQKYVKALSFHPGGSLRSLQLQSQTEVMTPLGPMPAELISWYKSGAVKRVFPRNGRLSAYWTEADEGRLAHRLDLNLAVGRVRARIVGLHFYESGALKSLTLWPGERVSLTTPVGPLEVRIGFALYPSGALKSCEPAEPRPLATTLGRVTVYDEEANGVNADDNSLAFGETGRLEGWATTDVVVATDPGGGRVVIRPRVGPHPFSDTRLAVHPRRYRLTADRLVIDDGAAEPGWLPLAGTVLTSQPFQLPLFKLS